jgi:hypothetical protein
VRSYDELLIQCLTRAVKAPSAEKVREELVKLLAEDGVNLDDAEDVQRVRVL